MSKGALMTLRIRDWERPLLSLAYEAGQARGPLPRQSTKDKRELDSAYDFCEAVTAVNSRSFFFASRFLPPDKRRSVRALYAFCRKSDDIVDKPSSDSMESRFNMQNSSFRVLRAIYLKGVTRHLKM